MYSIILKGSQVARAPYTESSETRPHSLLYTVGTVLGMSDNERLTLGGRSMRTS